MEEERFIDCKGTAIEALLEKKSGRFGLVVTHPHPLYGGDMHNPVVDIVRRAFSQHGFTTLRFNFRGTGRSQGRFDNGRGEQDDVRAAIDFVKGLRVETIVLAGYSFGAWVNALSGAGANWPLRMMMVSPPVAFIDFVDVQSLPELDLVITGQLDEIAPAGQIAALMPAWNRQAKLEIIPGADHFYSQAGSGLDQVVGRYAAGLANQKPS